MRRIMFSFLALAACGNVDVIGSFVVRPTHDAGVDSPNAPTSTPQPTAADTPAPPVPEASGHDATTDVTPGAGHDAQATKATTSAQAGAESLPPAPAAAADPLCLRSGLDPSVCESA